MRAHFDSGFFVRISHVFTSIALGVLTFFNVGCVSQRIAGRMSDVRVEELFFVESGVASYYDESFDGKSTASGEFFDSKSFTAAHPTLPFGTVLLVRRSSSKRFVLVRVNDRGPFRGERRLDLSKAAASKLGLVSRGVGKVEIYIVPDRSTLAAML